MTQKLSNNKKRRLNEFAEQAWAYASKGKFAAALNICDKADSLFENFPEIVYVRGMSAAMQGDYPSASTWLEQASKAMPKNLSLMVNLANALLFSNREEEAVPLYAHILENDPQLFEKANGYGAYAIALSELGEYNRAMQFFDEAIKRIQSGDLELIKKAAHICHVRRNSDKAISLLEKARSSHPENYSIPFQMALLLMQWNRHDEARALLRETLRIHPGHIGALSLLVASGEYEERQADITRLQTIYEQAEPDSNDRLIGAYALGDEADRSGEYSAAFNYWSEGNRMRRAQVAYHDAEQERLFKAAIAPFSAERFTHAACKGASDAAPIFIVGMPRCGSSLLERALSLHPDLTDAGEIGALQQSIAGRMRKPSTGLIMERLESLDDAGFLEVGTEYARRLAEEHNIDGRAIDKSLGNFGLIGAITKALPNARIIHLARDPMASCLSMFQAHFTAGVNYSFDLDELGRHYNRYLKAMQHWRDVLPSGVMLEVHYEELVSNTESELHRVLEFCNVEWNDACLQTHKAGGSVSTASVFQVRKPIHQKSIARWKHYEAQLAPLKKHLTQ
ncbi:Tetratricopeptide (TPR) repeat [Mariprofundus ferrinatatus]|uniref:Tetratricopeptide (TPR) repeat n=1 Tax=Mariprofundus ferrinatatus TaxID=1921087 RepID=A0A2K8L6T5_9PROT|nr:tetratricopeptide repeat-containing sulfotransferase family protein [Mariprofundus ferrinatatus]ATX83020.1 Tetratricopeptide (TPR) repeat [Mariprofundus ferrinatatus]